MAKGKLTVKAVRQFIENAAEKDRYWDTQVQGLHIVKRKAGGRWALHYRTVSRKARTLGLGSYPAITVDQARHLAYENIALIESGKDPLEARREAEEVARLLEDQTVGAYLEGPYALVQSRKKGGQRTLDMLWLHFKAWHRKPMSNLVRADVERWQVKMEEKGLSYATVQRVYGALQTMLNSARRRGAIPANPIADVKLERPAMTEEELADSATSRRYLEAWEVEALFAALDAYQEVRREQRRSSRAHGKPYLFDLDNVAYVDFVVPWISAMYYTGFRPGDLFGLRWEHINLNFATITKTIEKTAHHQPKPRSFLMSKPLVKIMTDWWKQEGSPKVGYVWPSKNGGRRSSTGMRGPWARLKSLSREMSIDGALEKGLDNDLHLYTLRHNFASQLIMAGADLLTVSKLMAHTDINTTIKHYGHLRPDLARDYIEQFASRSTRPKPLISAAG